LQLIERQDLDITKVALAQVADQYLEYIALLPDVQPGMLADFLVVAARLILIKSRALLPKPPEPREEPEAEDDGEALARQLIEYKRFKEAAAQLRQWEEAGLHSYPRTAPPPKTWTVTPKPPEGVTLTDLAEALQAVLDRLGASEPTGAIAPVLFSISDKIALIQETVGQQGRTSFQALLATVTTKLEAIVTFLALLELIKQQQVAVYQDETFGEIYIAAGGGNA
jgi:segregation and condensation protein A